MLIKWVQRVHPGHGAFPADCNRCVDLYLGAAGARGQTDLGLHVLGSSVYVVRSNRRVQEPGWVVASKTSLKSKGFFLDLLFNNPKVDYYYYFWSC